MSLEDEAKKFMQGKKNSFPRLMEENLKVIEVIAEVTLKKLRELNAKNNSNL